MNNREKEKIEEQKMMLKILQVNINKKNVV
jgi:hypothetical protein